MTGTSDDGVQRDAAGGHHGDHSVRPPSSRALHWAQLTICAVGIIGAVAIWAFGGPPLLAGAVATAAAGGAGWQITFIVRR
ncbi:hypothetical protein [Streptomyces sp. NPDC088789]|uniref:hypothetical protein n=1 Tax=Streptomyces sp. NPDC088789 TaxID=3365899 RepID=UPI00380E304B